MRHVSPRRREHPFRTFWTTSAIRGALEFPSLKEAFSWAEKNHAKCAFNQPRVSVYEVTEETHDEPERWEEVEAWYVTSDGTEREPIDLD